MRYLTFFYFKSRIGITQKRSIDNLFLQEQELIRVWISVDFEILIDFLHHGKNGLIDRFCLKFLHLENDI